MLAKEVRQKILEKSKGAVSFLGDYLLLLFLTGVEISFGGYGSRNVWRASDRAFDEFLEIKGVKDHQVRRTVDKLKTKGYIQYPQGRSNPQITKAGLKRLRGVLPFYDKERIWDGKMYIVTYDIPESRKWQREVLRDYLQKIGCGRLQASVWITPYDPREVLKKFVLSKGLTSFVIISEVGERGMIGGETFKELVWRTYKLEELSDRYKKFVEDYSKNSRPPTEVIIQFLGILTEDPQLPFALLPKDWEGSKAYPIYKRNLQKAAKTAAQSYPFG